jgi:hypothetical protein
MWIISFLSHRSIPLPDLFIVCDCGALLVSPSDPHDTCSPTCPPLTGYHSLTSHSQQLPLIFIFFTHPRLLALALGPSSPSPISFSRLPFPSSPWPSLGSLELAPTSSSFSTSVSLPVWAWAPRRRAPFSSRLGPGLAPAMLASRRAPSGRARLFHRRQGLVVAPWNVIYGKETYVG